MAGYLSLVLHAHLPFVRHPEHERFLEESWLFEAITESYVPLLQGLDRWWADGLEARLALTLSPTLCSMLQDSLLQDRYLRRLEGLVDLAEKEVLRTHWQKPFRELALFYHHRLECVRDYYLGCGRDLVGRFRRAQDRGQIEIVTTAATHALLPLLLAHPPSVRGQLRVACDHYRSCFGRDPRGIWLSECAYAEGLDQFLAESNLRWFILDTHGLMRAQPRPRYATFAPLFTDRGVAAFGRDPDSARQVWSRQEGYPGDPRYRDFYRDIGFDLDFDYIEPYVPSPGQRGFTGIKYCRVTGSEGEKAVYERQAALEAAAQHADHFLAQRLAQCRGAGKILDRPPLLVAPYDAELFGHWWYEGPEFLDSIVRKAAGCRNELRLITPGDYLREHPTNQLASPSASSWGEEGHWRVWLNEANEWIYPHLAAAQERMTELAGRFPSPAASEARALKQAARELLLAQASDWPFILRTGTSPDYARRRVKQHLLRFTRLYDQLTSSQLDESWISRIETRDNLFPDVDYRYWVERREERGA
jgi:1,4-alpha-glucan branching enzyme